MAKFWRTDNHGVYGSLTTITDKLDSDDFYNLTDLALRANNSSHHDFDSLHELAKKALDYEYTKESKDTLENFLDEIIGRSGEVLE